MVVLDNNNNQDNNNNNNANNENNVGDMSCQNSPRRLVRIARP